jgi:copper chaperone CopZ
MNIFRRVFVALGLATLFAPTVATAAEPALITISIQGMHCAGCAGKVKRNLQGVAGVASAQADAKAASATVVAQQGASPSAKALWEAVERAGYKPVKLVTPAGTFTSKPKS